MRGFNKWKFIWRCRAQFTNHRQRPPLLLPFTLENLKKRIYLREYFGVCNYPVIQLQRNYVIVLNKKFNGFRLFITLRIEDHLIESHSALNAVKSVLKWRPAISQDSSSSLSFLYILFSITFCDPPQTHLNSIETILIDLDLSKHWKLFALLVVVLHHVMALLYFVVVPQPQDDDDRVKEHFESVQWWMHPSKFWWSRNVHKHCIFCCSVCFCKCRNVFSCAVPWTAITTTTEAGERRQRAKDRGNVWCKDIRRAKCISAKR